ncbi:hypothetical protein [Phenylobacterium sp. SCN 70-31]|uniref:terminase small subunit-like protein n=1 Tax=Phenylobacterium sp. SCN 70-31 TaxID=1660129 RepID=UPI00086E38C4|nr:hypothetical protein [Phenylobacterium sp. SCN 70-31]ODT85988.1 MAG: hypothetical protein ABS78_17840 [Phenylobacterium sp. SCN 70-31]
MSDRNTPSRFTSPVPWMDKAPGFKDTAFTWAMGDLILGRVMAGETMKAITADPRMPAYCTVYRWAKVVPEFGDVLREARVLLAAMRISNADARRQAFREWASEGRRRDGRRRGGGKGPSVPAAALEAVLQAIRDGASMLEATQAPGAASSKAIYSRVRGCPGFRAAFEDACGWRDLTLWMAAERAIDACCTIGIQAAAARLRAAGARRGRLTPRLYRDGAAEQARRWRAPR